MNKGNYGMIPGNKSRKLRYDHEYQLECLTYILQCKMYLNNRERSSLWCNKYKPKTLRKVTSCKFKTRYDLQNLVETTKFKAMFRNTVEITIQRVSRGGGGCSRIPSEIFRLFHLFHLFPTDSSCSLVPPGHINTIFLALFPCVPIASNMLCSPAPLQVNYVKRSSFKFLTWLQFSSLLSKFEKLPCKSLEGIFNVLKNQINFPQFLLEVLNFLLQVPNFLFCSARCNWLTKIIHQW
jgi:hypothetical protein